MALPNRPPAAAPTTAPASRFPAPLPPTRAPSAPPAIAPVTAPVSCLGEYGSLAHAETVAATSAATMSFEPILLSPDFSPANVPIFDDAFKRLRQHSDFCRTSGWQATAQKFINANDFQI